MKIIEPQRSQSNTRFPHQVVLGGADETRGQFDIELVLGGAQGEASAICSFQDVPETRGLPTHMTLIPPAGDPWAEGNPELGIEVALCGVSPKDSSGIFHFALLALV